MEKHLVEGCYFENVGAAYDIMLRKRHVLPSKKSGIISYKFLMKVNRGEVWTPKYGKFSPLPCPTPPTKDTIYDYLIETINTK